MPPTIHPILIKTFIKTGIWAVSSQLLLLPLGSRVLAICMIALGSGSSFSRSHPLPGTLSEFIFGRNFLPLRNRILQVSNENTVPEFVQGKNAMGVSLFISNRYEERRICREL
ncbi:hypothetical protein DFH08DRAFT_840599 [Mycena albidolilacea]|uniref:Uncharacterized protein n=1 Tax=Mycena albidolilacea TaxID=1033008 RepID=A0AAD7ALG3_9AGAR|nr:hypothetical protein DFH08DRAFT_840599 [Mycena albidolilacea]